MSKLAFALMFGLAHAALAVTPATRTPTPLPTIPIGSQYPRERLEFPIFANGVPMVDTETYGLDCGTGLTCSTVPLAVQGRTKLRLRIDSAATGPTPAATDTPWPASPTPNATLPCNPCIATNTPTRSFTPVNTPTVTPTFTAIIFPTAFATITPMACDLSGYCNTPTLTKTPTLTATPTNTFTNTPTFTPITFVSGPTDTPASCTTCFTPIPTETPMGATPTPLTLGAFTATSPMALSASRSVVGGADVVSIANAAADGATLGAAAFTAADFNATSGVVSLDYTNAQKATGLVPGFLIAADWTTFNGKQASGSYLTALTGDVTASGPGSAAATIASATSATWAGRVSDEVGTGKWVFNDTPTILTPTIADFTNATHSHNSTASGGFFRWVGYVTSTFSTSSTSLVDVTGLVSSTLVPNGGAWVFHIVGNLQSSTSAGLKIAMKCTSASTLIWFNVYGVAAFNHDTISGSGTLSSNLPGSSTALDYFNITGTVVPPIGGCALSLQIQKTTSGTASISTGTSMILEATT